MKLTKALILVLNFSSLPYAYATQEASTMASAEAKKEAVKPATKAVKKQTSKAAKKSAAKATPKSGRTTELGVAQPVTGKQGEQEILLNDPSISEAWGLKMTSSQKAWRLSQGDRNIVVAVIDTGADVRHEDLQSNLWVNKGEVGLDAMGRDKATNGIDDDKNGLVDDVHGWNFAGNNNKLNDNHGHGTHIAGIIGAEGGNGKGISGVSPKVSLMILKYFEPNSSAGENLKNTVKAINYAVKMKANIINYSGGGIEPSTEEKTALKAAEEAGILVVAAAGNERSNSDFHHYYPADYDLNNIVSVTAIDKTQNVLSSSNYGEETVDIAAPGFNIYSTLPGGQYGYMTGTSQATAFVSGVAALVMAKNPELRKAEQVIKYLTNTGDTDMKLAGKTRFLKRLNSYNALAMQNNDFNFNGTRTNQVERPDTSETSSAARDMASLAKQLQKHIQPAPSEKADVEQKP